MPAARRTFVAFGVVAVLATAWLLFGDRGVGRPTRANPQATPDPAPGGMAGAVPDTEKPGPPDAPTRPDGSGAAGPIRVRVVDVDGRPVAGATVEAYGVGMRFPLGARPICEVATGTDGVAVPPVAPGQYWVRATRGDAASFPHVVGGWTAERTLVLEPARVLRGIVLMPDGSPAAGAVLTFHGGELFSGLELSVNGHADTAGRFDLVALPDAWFDHLRATACGFGPDSRPTPRCRFDLGPPELLKDMITLQLTAVHVRARVVGEEGMPVACAMILWVPPEAPDPPSFKRIAATDDDGRFVALVQRLAGEAFLIEADGYAPAVWRPEAAPADRKLNVPEIRLARGVPLAGRVTDPDGHPIPGAAVRLESPRLRGQVIAQTITGAEGRFRFERITDEEHVLYAFRPVDPDLCLPQLRVTGVRGGPDDLRVVLPEPIHGTVRFVAQGTGDAISVEHLTLIVKNACGAEVAKRTWEPSLELAQVRFEVWEEGAYDLETYTARQEPGRVVGVNVVRGRGPEVTVPLVPRR